MLFVQKHCRAWNPNSASGTLIPIHCFQQRQVTGGHGSPHAYPSSGICSFFSVRSQVLTALPRPHPQSFLPPFPPTCCDAPGMVHDRRQQKAAFSPPHFPDPSLTTQRNVGVRGTGPAVRTRLGTLGLGEREGLGGSSRSRPPQHTPPCTGCPLFSRSSLKRNFRSRSWMTASFEPWISSSEAMRAVLLAFLGNPLWASTQRGQGHGQGQGQGRGQARTTTPPTPGPAPPTLRATPVPLGVGPVTLTGTGPQRKSVHPGRTRRGEMRAKAGELATNTWHCLYPDLGFHRVRSVTLRKLPSTCHKQV